MTQEAPRWNMATEWNEEERGPRVLERLHDFNAFVKSGDSIVIIREEYLAIGVFGGTTEGRFNYEEVHIDLQDAAVFPVNILGAKPRDVFRLLSMLDFETKDIEVDLGKTNFLVYRVS